MTGEKRTIEELIGKRIKSLRKLLGLSQMELAERVGVSFQQIQKYEKGTTNISVFRLEQIAEALGVPIRAFFEADVQQRVAEKGTPYGAQEPVELLSKEELTLLKLFRRIRNKKIREGLLKQLQGVVELGSKRD